MELNRFETAKGKPAFCQGGYTYRLDKRAADGERYYWRCIDHACTVTKETMGLDCVPQPRGAAQHTHAPKCQ